MVATREADERGLRADHSDHRAAAGGLRPLGGSRSELWVSLAVVAACCIYIFVQLKPGLLFLDTTTAGGDTGGTCVPRVSARPPAAALPARRAGRPTTRGLSGRAVLLPAAGTADRHPRHRPAVQRRVQARDRVGPILLPISAYVFGRGIRAPRPAPALFAVANHRLPVLQGRRRSDHEVRPPHHGWDAHEHAGG